MKYHSFYDFKNNYEYDPSSPTFVRHTTDKGHNKLNGAPAGQLMKKGGIYIKLTDPTTGLKSYLAVAVFVLHLHGISFDHRKQHIWYKDGNSLNYAFENMEVLSKSEYKFRVAHKEGKYDMYCISRCGHDKIWNFVHSVDGVRHIKGYSDLDRTKAYRDSFFNALGYTY